MKELTEQEEYLPFGEPAHFMQRDILTLIKEATSPLSYSNIKPNDVDGNAFNHHLKTLMGKGMIEKTGEGLYILTPKGRRGVDFYSIEDSRVKVRPVSGIFILVQSADGMILSYRNEAAPTNGHTGLLFGKLRLGDSQKNTVERMLKRRLLNVEWLRFCGSLNVRYTDSNELVAHRCGPLFIAKIVERADKKTEYGSSTQKISWSEPGRIESEELMSAMRMAGGIQTEYTDLEINLS